MGKDLMISQPLQLPNGSILRNRIVKAAMSEALGDVQNDTTEGHIKLFERWSKGGAAMLITGNVQVDRWHLEHAANIVLDDQSNMKRAREFAEAAKSGGALVLAQLSYAGRQTPEAINPNPLSISDLRLDLPGYGAPKAATEEDLQGIINKFVRSAVLANEAGFDGVQFHAAHGYMLSSSLSPRINTRTDRWGGSLENRARLVLSIVRAVRSELGPEFIVATKLNSSDFQKGGFTHEQSIEVARMLQTEGIDFLEISGGNFESPAAYQYASKTESSVAREAYFLDYARDIKASLRIPVMVTGGFRSAEVMNSALTDNSTDLIGIARPFIIDPEFPFKLMQGSIDRAPDVERNFPSAEVLPESAPLNWFSHQLALHGTEGDSDPSISIIQGHESCLARSLETTKSVMMARNVKF
jgi:2,4-dienoyl-CoA reductase-like NADH-dependent reductase (Old Yellow Enzyme family)